MEKLYKIEQPNLSNIEVDLTLLSETRKPEVKAAIKRACSPEYLHWKDLKYKNWIPDQFRNHKEKFWLLVKFARQSGSAVTKIRDHKKNFFTWKKLNHYEEMLHEITLDMSRYLLDIPDASSTDYQKYQSQSLIEEAIASSQLEGAHTTRKAAKRMIEEKREPKTADERMIYNNFIAMKAIQEKFKNEKLSLDVLFDLHRMLTIGTDSVKEHEQGRFRLDSDKIVITKGDDPTVISYVTPPMDFVKKEIFHLIDFANDELDEKDFVHPVIKAIMLHFWIGLLHPFVDGNGRLARGLFYWYLLRKGYWAFAFLPISIAIKAAPAQYSEAYILSEQDDTDLTYFINYHIKKINEAIENFRKFFKQKSLESRKINKILNEHNSLNRRQIETLANIKQNPERQLTATLYKNIHNITKVTAIKDLRTLRDSGFVVSRKKGRNIFYTTTKKIDEIF
ncbi:MAG: Fic family protein [Alphaproteobacteria bacterium]|nr:Fic family protein [Alphaproteobacteria bacterium]